MSTFFYAMHRGLNIRKSLTDTIDPAPWKVIKMTKIEKIDVQDIETNKMWQIIYDLIRTVFTALQVLRVVDSNQAFMDKLYYLWHRTTHAITKSSTSLNDGDFLSPTESGNDAGDLSFDTSYDDDDNIDDNIEEDKVTCEDDDEVDEDIDVSVNSKPDSIDESFADRVLRTPVRRKSSVERKFSIADSYLSVQP